jgi:hypothetical protein
MSLIIYRHVSQGIVDAVRKIGGRFLTYDEDRKIYTDLDDEKARVKASQALRDALNSRRNSQKENGVYEEEEKRCTNEVPQEWYSNYLYQELMRNHSNSSTRTTDAEQISQREGDRDENVLDSLEPLNYKHDHGLPNRNLTKKSISTRSEFSQLSKDVMSSMSGMSLSTLSLDADMLDVEKFSVPENKNVNVITPGSKRSTSRKMEFPIRESVVDDYEQGMLTVIGKKSASVPEEKLSTLTFNEEGVGQKDNDSFFRLADKVAKNNAGVPLSGHSLMSS